MSINEGKSLRKNKDDWQRHIWKSVQGTYFLTGGHQQKEQ